jgi:hypothetical protein
MAVRSSALASGVGPTITPTAPAGFAAGDRLLLFVASDFVTGLTATPPTGFTQIGAIDETAPDGGSLLVFEKKVAAGGESFNCSVTGSTTDYVAITVALTGRHASSAAVLQSTLGPTVSTAGGTFTATGLSATAGDDVLLFTQTDPTTNIVVTVGTPASWTHLQGAQAAGGFVYGAADVFPNWPTTGATGSTSQTITTTSLSWSVNSWMVAIPAAASAGIPVYYLTA